MAITHANRLLYWQENLDQDEMPPVWMQPYDEPLARHFERISEERKSRYGGDDTPSDGDEDGAGMMTMVNEYARDAR